MTILEIQLMFDGNYNIGEIMSDSRNEIMLSLNTVENLVDTAIWSPFLSEVEQCLGAKLSHLDDNDPVRKKVENIDNVGEFICAFGEQENSRWLFGRFDRKFGRCKITITISLSRGSCSFPSSVDIYYPHKILEDKQGLQTILNVFELGNKHLKAFYSYSDIVGQIVTKKKATRTSVDFEAELGGMFWLTYLNSRYIEFFGQDKVDQLPKLDVDTPLDGEIFRFGELPASDESIAAKAAAEELLGAIHFVDPTLAYDKLPGKHALLYDQLRS